MNKADSKEKASLLRKPHVWCFTTYFAEGFPYAVIRLVAPIFFRDMKVSLESIGLTSLFGIPWIIKFLWAPLLDRFSTKRTWMLAMQILLGLIALAMAFFSSSAGGIGIVAVLLLAGSVFAATHDTAIDGYYLEGLDKTGQTRFVGYRVMAYRIAMMTGTGVIVTIGAKFGWQLAFTICGVLLIALFAYHSLFLSRVEATGKPVMMLLRAGLNVKTIAAMAVLGTGIALLYAWTRSQSYTGMRDAIPALKSLNFSAQVTIVLLLALTGASLSRKAIWQRVTRNPDSFYARAFVSFMDQERIGMILAFIILVRAGEFMLSAMVSPFMVDMGIKVHYGWISGFVGLPCSIAGALWGGWLISKFTLRKMVWPFIFAQNLTNVVYMLLALALSRFVVMNTGVDDPTPLGFLNLVNVAAVHGFDQFAGGLGTSVLMTLLMRLCSAEFRAAHYAIGSGLMSLGGVVAGITSGFIAARIGYGAFFGISFIVSIPGIILIGFIPRSMKE